MSKKVIYGVVLLIVLVGIVLVATKPSREEQETGETEDSYVPWSEAVTILSSGEVGGVVQTHDLEVEFLLKDGTTIKTKEPVIDDIFREITKCGSVCEGITRATE